MGLTVWRRQQGEPAIVANGAHIRWQEDAILPTVWGTGRACSLCSLSYLQNSPECSYSMVFQMISYFVLQFACLCTILLWFLLLIALFQVYSWLSGGNTVTNTPATVATHIIQAANAKLSEAVKRNFEEPKAHLQSFGSILFIQAAMIYAFPISAFYFVSSWEPLSLMHFWY